MRVISRHFFSLVFLFPSIEPPCGHSQKTDLADLKVHLYFQHYNKKVQSFQPGPGKRYCDVPQNAFLIETFEKGRG